MRIPTEPVPKQGAGSVIFGCMFRLNPGFVGRTIR